MPRVKGGTTTRARRKKILKLAKGYIGSRRLLYKTAHEQVMKSLSYAYRDRKQRKRNFRKLWISRINAACKLNDFKYSKLIHGLALANVQLNRKMLAELAIEQPEDFKNLVDIARNAINGDLPKAAKASGSKAEVKAEDKAQKVEVIEPVEKVETTASEVDYEQMKVSELKEIAKEKGLSGFTAMKKAELIELLKK